MTDHINLDTLALEKGGHDTPEDGVCIMEAVAWWAGEPHSDRPACVSVVIGAFLRKWNDDLDDDTRQKLKRFIPQLPGTAADAKTEERRAWQVTGWMIRTYLPAWLRLAGMRDQAEAVEQLPACVNAETAEASQKTLTAVEVAARAVTRAATRDVVWVVAGDVAEDATRAAACIAAWDAVLYATRDAAWDAACTAARAAAWDATRAVAWDATRDVVRIVANDVAWAVMRAAAWDALRPTVESLQESALQLVDELIAMQPAKVEAS